MHLEHTCPLCGAKQDEVACVADHTMKPPRNPQSLSNEALAIAARAWDTRLAELLEQYRARNPEFAEALDTACLLEEELERRLR